MNTKEMYKETNSHGMRLGSTERSDTACSARYGMAKAKSFRAACTTIKIIYMYFKEKIIYMYDKCRTKSINRQRNRVARNEARFKERRGTACSARSVMAKANVSKAKK